jgi:cell shape-determining protein MreC
MTDLPISARDLLLGLQVVISVMVVVVLYHILFVAVDLRKILRRVDDITEQVEAIILKPISLADQLLQKLIELLESSTQKKRSRKGKGKHKKMTEG